MKHDCTHPLSVAYRKVRNWYVAELRFAEKAYFERQYQQLSNEKLSQDPHNWWKKAKSMCGMNKCDTIPALVSNGKTCLSASEKADCLNDSFALQCSAPAKPTDCSHDSASNGPNPPRLFRFREIDIPEVQKELESLPTWKSPGLDGLPNIVLKKCSNVLAPPLHHILHFLLNKALIRSNGRLLLSHRYLNRKATEE